MTDPQFSKTKFKNNPMDYHQTRKLRERLRKRKASHIQMLHEEAQRLTKEAAKMGALKVILFGSLARGTLALSSDLDLIIVLEDKQDYLNRTASVYKRLKPRIGVDLLIYTPEEIKKMENNPFFQQSLTQGRVLYEA